MQVLFHVSKLHIQNFKLLKRAWFWIYFIDCFTKTFKNRTGSKYWNKSSYWQQFPYSLRILGLINWFVRLIWILTNIYPIIFLCSAKLNAQESLSVHFLSGVRLSFCKHFHLLFPNKWVILNKTWHEVSFGEGDTFFLIIQNVYIFFFKTFLKKNHLAKCSVDSNLFQSSIVFWAYLFLIFVRLNETFTLT